MNIFISNISFKVREQALQELFAQHGEVTSVRIIKDKETRRSKGYGFVEMAHDNAALKVVPIFFFRQNAQNVNANQRIGIRTQFCQKIFFKRGIIQSAEAKEHPEAMNFLE